MVCHTHLMRTTLDLDDALMSALLLRLPGYSKTQAIETAVHAYLAEGSASRLRELAGTLEIDDLSVELRRRDRHS
jgi:Arc/MetJ family transcription regulator